MIAKILILIGLVKLLQVTNSPFLCSGIYVVVGLLLGLIFGIPFTNLIIPLVVGFVLASVYFWLLNQLESGILWWIILIGGAFIGLV